MQPPDPRDPNSAASADWPGETWTGQRPNENPTLPRMTPVPSPHDAPASGPSAPQSAAPAIPPLPSYGPPSSGPMGATLIAQQPQPMAPQPVAPQMQPIQPAQPMPLQGYPVAGPPQQQLPPRPASAVNLAAVPSGVWLAGGGALAMLIGSFLPWITVSVTGANNVVKSQSQSGWDLSAFGRVTALIGLLALALFVVRLLNLRLPVRLPWSDRNIYMALGVEALLLGILYLIDNAHTAVNIKGFSVGPAFGLFLTVLGAVALTGGAYLLGRPTPAARPMPPAR